MMEMNAKSYHCHDRQFSGCCVALMTLKCDTDVGYFVKKLFLILMLLFFC